MWTPPQVYAGERGKEIATLGRLGQQHRGGGGEQLAAENELGGTVAVGQEAVVADALKTGRDGVLQEAADELLGGKGHGLGLVAVAIILPLESDHAVFQRQDAPVGDGDAVGITAEILQYVLGSAKGRLGIDDPLAFAERSQIAGEELWVGKVLEVAKKLEFTGNVGLV